MANIFFYVTLICFILGVLIGTCNFKIRISERLNKVFLAAILFLIGLKGGSALFENLVSMRPLFFSLSCLLVAFGFLQPFLSFYLLKKFTSVDFSTAAAISASFGSVSLMTFVGGVSFLDTLDISYQGFIIGVLAIMEIPAIISGLFLAKRFGNSKISTKNIILHAIFNQAIFILILGLLFGGVLSYSPISNVKQFLLLFFNPILSSFLFDMGLRIGSSRQDFRKISKSLISFAFYMPLIGGLFGLFCSYFLRLDVGTGTLVVILCASASYIAVPAAMKLALPEAKESIYLSVPLAITFPFNLIIGIPLYYYLAKGLLT